MELFDKEKWVEQKNCPHDILTLKECPMSDGRMSYREFCTKCDKKLIHFVPLHSDADVKPLSMKYRDKTLGEIIEIDKEYVKWVALESKAASSIRRAALRLYSGSPFILPPINSTYPRAEGYERFLK